MEKLEKLYEERDLCLANIYAYKQDIKRFTGYYEDYNNNKWAIKGLPISVGIGGGLGIAGFGITYLVQNIVLNSTFNEAIYEFISTNSSAVALSVAVLVSAVSSTIIAKGFKKHNQKEKNYWQEELKKCEEKMTNSQNNWNAITKQIKTLQGGNSAKAIPPRAKQRTHDRISGQLYETNVEIRKLSKKKANKESALRELEEMSIFKSALDLFPIALFPFMGVPIGTTSLTAIWTDVIHRSKLSEITTATQEYANQVVETTQSKFGITLTPETSGPNSIIHQMNEIKASLSGADLTSWGVYTNQVSAKLSSIPTEILGFDQVGLVCGVLAGSMFVVTAGIGGVALINRKKKIENAIKKCESYQNKLDNLYMQKQILENDYDAIKNGGELLNDY